MNQYFLEFGLLITGLWGLAVTYCIFPGLPFFKKKWKRTVVAMITGLLSIVATASAISTNYKQSITMENINGLAYYRNKKDAMRIADETNKKVLISFHAPLCKPCRIFDEISLNNQKLREALSNCILLRLYEADDDFNDFALDEVPELNISLPFYLVLSPQGDILYKSMGPADAGNLADALQTK